jgi:bacilliredoxin
MPYDPALVAPMRAELTGVGVQELLTAAEVEDWFGQSAGTSLMVVNSVCGCAAGQARPSVALAMGHTQVPARVATVFAGQDIEATAAARGHFGDVPPSSPSMALFKDGELVHFLPRHRIDSQSAEAIAAELTAAFDRFCAAPSGA